MTKMTLEEVVKSIKRNTFGVEMDIVTVPTMNKRGNKFYGRVTKASHYHNIAIGRGYSSTIERRAKELGIDVESKPYEEDKPTGRSWSDYPYFLTKDTDPTVTYLRIASNGNSKVTSTYFVDGREATPEEEAEIKTFLRSHSVCKKQLEYGLTPEEVVEVKDITVTNIVRIWQGNKRYERD